jgi:hypothetical protein
MDLGTNLLFLLIFGLFGFIISKIWGINPYRIFTDVIVVVILVSLVISMWPAIVAPEKAIDTIPNLVDVFANNLPGIIIGDLAGSFISAITD